MLLFGRGARRKIFPRARFLAFALVVLYASACSTPSAAPSLPANVPPPGMPALSAAEQAAITAKMEAAAAKQPKAAPLPPVGAAAGVAAPAGPVTPVVSGTVDVSPALRAKVTAGETVFVSVRRANAEPNAGGTSVLAVQKLTAGSWPLPFSVDSRDIMIEGTALSGDVVVIAWADHDGDPMTKGAGDLLGRTAPLHIPAINARVELNEEPQ